MPDAAPNRDNDPVDPTAEGAGADAADESPTTTDPDELMKQKYRDAIAHKHGASGASKKGHGDAGSSAHSQSAGPTQKLFRRKSGG
jgi:hypothetical protein